MIRPMQDYILVKPTDRVKSETLIVIDNEGTVQGEVIAVGPGRVVNGKRRPLDAKPGDTVRFKNHETYASFNGHVLIREPDIEFVMEGPRDAA